MASRFGSGFLLIASERRYPWPVIWTAADSLFEPCTSPEMERRQANLLARLRYRDPHLFLNIQKRKALCHFHYTTSLT